MIATAKKILSKIFLFTPFLIFSNAQAVTIPVRVLDSNGAGIQNARVFAVHFGNHGPDGGSSKMSSLSDAQGYVYLTLNDALDYDLLADIQNTGPSVRSQMFNPEHPHIFTSPADTSTQTITLAENLTGKAHITASITNATPNSMVFGNVRKISSGSDVAFGACVTNGSGACSIEFTNIPALAASALSNNNSYDVSAFDPANGENGKGNGGQIAGVVVANSTYPISIDISGGLPPDLSANAGGNNNGGNNSGPNGPSGNVTVEGVVEDIAYSSMTIPWGGISFRVLDTQSQTKVDRFGTGVDQNGRFQIFANLDIGTTYYVRAFGGCRQDGICYEGYESTGTAVFVNRGDFLYTSSTTVKIIHVKLRRAAPGNTNLAVYAKDPSGHGLPGTNINVWPDGTQWHTNPNVTPLCAGGFSPVNISSPGFINANLQTTTGYAQITGLRPGNYLIQAFSQFGGNQPIVFNGGADNKWEWGPQGGGNFLKGCFTGSEDDLRLTVEENGKVNIYNSSGAIVAANVSSVTITVPLSTTGAGHITGTLTFPSVVDLSANPITITMRGGCGPKGCNGGFSTIGDNEAPASSYTYDIQVSTFEVTYDNSNNPNGTKEATYFPEIVSNYWGRIQDNNDQDQVVFKDGGSTSITKNFKFGKAGRVLGKLFKPDGSVFQPSQGQGSYTGASINAHGITGHSWGYTQILQDGSFLLGGLTPGEYELEINTFGNDVSSYASPEPRPKVIVTANADTYKDLRLVDGVVMVNELDFASLPTLTRSIDSSRGGGNLQYVGENWNVFRFPTGFAFTPDNLGKVLAHGFETQQLEDVPAYGGGSYGRCGSGPWAGGICPNQVPNNTSFDMYLTRYGNIDGGIHQYMTILNTKKNVPVDNRHQDSSTITFNGNSVHPVKVNLTPSSATRGATVKGDVRAIKLFREQDFKSLGGSFENFIKYIPVVALYDSNGQLVGAGLVTPPPATIAGGNAIDDAVANNDFAAFKAAIGNAVWGYEIRGIPAGKTYSLVGTTPNYPPVSKAVDLGVDGSTSTVDIDWDKEAGEGATIKGVVKSTATSNSGIANAQIEIGVKGAKSKIIVSDTDGSYVAAGLPLGNYKVKVTADGYAPSSQIVDATDFSTTTLNMTLNLASGELTGTVRELVLTSRGPVIKPVSGATVLAYDDTENLNHPNKPLALYKTETSSAGVYSITNVTPGDVYKIFAIATGRYIKSVSTAATAGIVSGVDIDLKLKPLQVNVFAKLNPPYYEFSILNPNNFESGRVFFENAAGGFDINVASEITNNFNQLPDGSLLGKVPLSALDSSLTYILHIVATPANGEADVVKEITFGKKVRGNTQQPLDEKLIGDDSSDETGRKNNEITMGEGSGVGVELPTGSMIQTSTADIPTIILTQSSTDSLSGNQSKFDGTFTGDAFNIDFSSVQFTGRNIILNLPYDQSVVGGNISNVKIFKFNPNTGVWEIVSGQITIDPVTGVVSISASSNTLAGFQAPLNNAALGASSVRPRTMLAATTSKQFVFNAQASSSGSGLFVVGLAASSGTANASNIYKQYNFPNPFNLQQKSVTLRSGTGSNVATSIRGTYIVVAPTGTGTNPITVRIYNVAGDLVREIMSSGTSGVYNYIHWDGRNTAGDDVASGVYFAKVEAPGAPKRDPIKLVVVK